MSMSALAIEECSWADEEEIIYYMGIENDFVRHCAWRKPGPEFPSKTRGNGEGAVFWYTVPLRARGRWPVCWETDDGRPVKADFTRLLDQKVLKEKGEYVIWTVWESRRGSRMCDDGDDAYRWLSRA